MKIQSSIFTIALFLSVSAQATDAKYRAKLESSGCTQVSELQGCDINKTKAENAKAGFGTAPAKMTPPTTAASTSAYAGKWIAKNSGTGQTVATISIDNKERVLVNGKAVSAKRSDGALVFKTGFITFTIQGDPRVRNESRWNDSEAKTSGPIRLQSK